EVVVDGAGEVHHVAGVAVAHGRQDQQFIWDVPAGAAGDLGGADDVHVERQGRGGVLDRPAPGGADLAAVDGVVDVGPGEFFVAVFLGGAAGHAYSFHKSLIGSLAATR